LEVTLAKCVSWFRASGGSIFLADGGDVFGLRAKFGEQDRLPDDASVTKGKGIAGIVAMSGVARLIEDPSLYPDMAGVEGNQGIASSMVIPLADTKRQVIGVLNISRKAGEPPFSEVDLDQAVALASHVSLAVGNAQLVNRLKGSVEAQALANEQLVAVLDSVGAAVWVVNGLGRVVNENFPAAELAGDGSASELSGALPEIIFGTLSQMEPCRRRIYDGGQDRTWLIRGTPLESGGAVIASQEITEHERRQRELSRVRRLAEIGQMTAAIAHEIRNPLTGIRSAAQMIKENPEMGPEFIGLIEEEAMKLNSLCDEFLEFARPMQLSMSHARLVDVVDPVVGLLRASAAESGVEIAVTYDSAEFEIELDSRRIGQVVHNLLRNAIEASPRGSLVRVGVGASWLSVRDDGAGMDEESLEKLFSPFFSTKANGTGLGLCTSRKIVDAHGGEIAVRSAVGGGTTFTVQLDREKP
jgi:signal transduction histidine kinase